MHAIGFGPRFAVNRGVRRSGAFDFTRGVLPSGATLTRASVGTRFDASGALVSMGNDVARFDYAAGALRGLLIEPAASNVVPYSNDWTNAYWARSNLGGGGGTLIEASGSSAAHIVRAASGGIDHVAGQGVTASAIASERSGSAKRYLLISLSSTPAFSGSTLAIFDLATGTVTGSFNTSAAGMIALGGGAWLCWMSATPVATTTTPQAILLKINSSATASNAYAGDGVSGLNVANVQVELGAVASSRIVTASAAADMLTLDWRSVGVADGTIGVRYTFDDASTQDVATTVSGGTATVPTTLARRWLRRAQKI